MGQRHQLFVIARINGKYRTLAALHHQWLYGHTALRRCLGTLKILQDGENRLPLEEELKMASKSEDLIWKSPEDRDQRNEPTIHFPFLMTCLIIGSSFSVEDGYFHGVHIEPFHMAYNQGDNNNGITVFDISRPEKTRYCFVDYYGMESERPVQLMTPLSAQTYLEAYYMLDDAKHVDLVKLVEQFKGRALIDVDALEDTWPDQWQESEIENDQGAQSEPDISKLSLCENKDPSTLRSRTLDQLVQAVVNGDENDSQILSDAELFTDFHPKVREKLYEQAGTLESSPEVLDLLFNSLKTSEYVDLSPFTRLSTAEISLLGIRLLGTGYVKSMNLSGWNIADHDLRTILGHQRIHKVLLMGDDGVSLSSLTSSKPKGDLYHHELLKRPLLDNRMGVEFYARCQPPLTFIDFSAPENAVVQLVWVHLSEYVYLNEACFRSDGGIAWSKLGPDTREPRQMSRGSDRGEPKYYKLPLVDVPMPLTRLIAGLSNVLQWMSKSDYVGTWEIHKGAASAFALGVSSDTLSCGVGPLSTELYLNNGTREIQSQGLEPGQWAIVLINDFYDSMDQSWIDERIKPKIEEAGRSSKIVMKKQVRYALVSPAKNSKGHFEVADVPKYLQMASNEAVRDQLSEWWRKQIAAYDDVQFYDEEDIQDILAKIYEPTAEGSVGSDGHAGESSMSS